MGRYKFPEGVQKSILTGVNGSEANVSRYEQLVVGLKHDDILCRFEYNNSTFDVGTPAVTGTGVASNSNSQAVASTGSGVGKCTFKTVRIMTYRPAHEIYVYGSVVFTAGTTNTVQRFGVFDDDDGFFIGYSGATFGLGIRKATSDTFIAQSSWNKDKCDGTGISGFTLNPAKNNQYKISYGWLGAAPISYYVYGGESLGWILFHVIDYTNTQTTPSINSPNFSIQWEVERTSGSGAITMAIGCVAGGSTEGVHAHAGHRVFAGRSSKAITSIAYPGDHIVTFHSKATFQSKTNKIRAEATWAGFSCDGTKPTEFILLRNCSISGASYSDINTDNSIFETTTAGTVTGGTFEMSFPFGKVDGNNFDIGAGHVHLEMFPGDTMSVFALSAGASDVVASFRWEEYFA